ncbi:hypothetical protein I4F81_012901 [Pyropia yezoensis]|uniref:Uncharacterized protein n=1 Tax=Pyropia yezoensis TaxID=2788 RepID=A0ACC3CJQ1_PYRYE|nr:hypothetical protein I4F81_012901 [Neopyropia yezoensis]
MHLRLHATPVRGVLTARPRTAAYGGASAFAPAPGPAPLPPSSAALSSALEAAPTTSASCSPRARAPCAPPVAATSMPGVGVDEHMEAGKDRAGGAAASAAGAEQDIKKKETVKETLAEKLKRLDEQLDRPCLRAEDEREMKAQRRMLYGEIGVANAALVGLYEDKRRTKNGVAVLEQEIAAEEGARRKADNEKSNVLVVNGPSGSGKTRVGFEALSRSTALSGDLLRALEQKARCSVLTIPLFIDFNNGFSYLDGVDGGNMDQNLGVRLAARALRVSAARVRRDNGRSLDGLETAEVLTAIVKGSLRRASEAAAAPPGVVLLVLHLDEYQVYLKDLMELQGRTSEGAELCFKKMLSAADDWVCSASAAVGAKLVFFPVVTGTPVAGVKLLLTDKLTQRSISPGRLLLEASAELLADVLTDGAERSPLRPGAVEALLASHQARNALGDTDFLPRHVVHLGKKALEVLPAAGDGAAMVSGIDWALAMGPLEMATLPLRRVENASTLALLALSQVPVQLDRTPFPVQRDMINAVVAGVVELEPVGDDFYVVRVPLIQLRRWGLASILPVHLLSQTLCTWEQVELIVGYCLTAALRPILRSSPLSIHNLFPGALGCDELRPHELILEEPCSLYVEETHFITRGRPVAQMRMALRARKEFEMAYDEVMLTDGVFLACRGNMAVDIRFSLPMRRRGERRGMLHVFVQTKQTGTSRRVSDGAVDAWYQCARLTTANWATDDDQVLYVYFSNKKLTDDGVIALRSKQFFKARPGLVVVTLDELSCVVPPFLLTRFTTAAQVQRQSV